MISIVLQVKKKNPQKKHLLSSFFQWTFLPLSVETKFHHDSLYPFLGSVFTILLI